MKTSFRVKPFLKWAGGKQQLLAQYDPFFPAEIPRYFEPFVGSGAVFFHLFSDGKLTGDIFLSDTNHDLINTYRVLRDQPEQLIAYLARHKKKHSNTYYYEVRNLDRQKKVLSDLERAARLIYLNKTCYNGLYRVNRKGQFNVPIGRYQNPKIYDPEALRAASKALQNATLYTLNFRAVAGKAQAGDFVYFDPPYDPLSKTANFTGYTAEDFRETDQHELAKVFAQLTAKGCKCMLSNAYTPFILDLYAPYRIEIVQATRAINSNAKRRGRVKEVLILNYNPDGEIQ
ncbi:MAG: DNA adenine methylase [Gemmatimonadetes bacterium]|nr:MAG: DNA adenine methylase [Gemmatimonadota bacterium]